MSASLVAVLGVMVVVDGLIHLIGFVAHWPLAAVAHLPYKTSLAAGLWNVGRQGMRLFSVLWLFAALGLLSGAAGLVAGQEWSRLALVSSVVLSMGIISLDWDGGYRRATVNVLILDTLILVALSSASIGMG